VSDSAPVRIASAYQINVHMARLYSKAREAVPAGTDFVWCIEDDIEPPADALDHFAVGFLTHERAGVLSGSVADRFGSNLLAWRLNWGGGVIAGVEHLKSAPAQGQWEQVTGSGFMCSIFRRAVWDSIAFRPSPTWEESHYTYYDWAAAHEVERLGWQWRIAGSIRCLHWQANGTALPCPI
jgi:hypothetical protein